MKRAISLVLLLLIIFSIAVFTVSCRDSETPVIVEKNPPKEDDDKNDDPGNITNPSIGGNDKDNTWNEDGNAIGRPVTLPSN